MNLQYRIDLLSRLGDYISGTDKNWQAVKDKAGMENSWFIPEFVESATRNIARQFLQKDILRKWADRYPVANTGEKAKSVGLIMAGNLPLVGFHDWMAVFISGHRAVVKPSSRDNVLFRHLAGRIAEWSAEAGNQTVFAEMLKGCDAYIATGSNNSSRYFEFYFGKYPHIIRRNRTSVAILSGNESQAEREGLADDVYLYFGLGCRNVTKIYVPEGYDFIPMLETFRKYNHLADHHKYKNNYDYNLAMHLLNKKYYMTNGSLLLVEEPALFSPISQLNYGYFTDREQLEESLRAEPDLQCIIGQGHTPFGSSQRPAIDDYADGVDTMAFLSNL